jgi:hypothetical protein
MYRNLLVLLVVMFAITGCKDRYDEGYAAGYADGTDAGEKIGYEKAQEQHETESRATESYYPSRYVTTEVCGGSGVNVNGKHYPGGKTGCVRVFSDGTVHRY